MEYRLISNDMFYAPGVMKWLQNVAKTDRPWAVDFIIHGYPGIPAGGIEKLLKGEYREVDDAVIVEV